MRDACAPKRPTIHSSRRLSARLNSNVVLLARGVQESETMRVGHCTSNHEQNNDENQNLFG